MEAPINESGSVRNEVLRVLSQETGLQAACCAGHSLGEFSALVCAGSLGFADAVQLVRQRGDLGQP